MVMVMGVMVEINKQLLLCGSSGDRHMAVKSGYERGYDGSDDDGGDYHYIMKKMVMIKMLV